MRSFPDAFRCENVPAENHHDEMSELASAEDSAVLVIMINHEHTRIEKKDKRAADNSSGEVDIPVGSCNENQKENECAHQSKPASPWNFFCKFPCCKDKFFTCSHFVDRIN